MRRTNATIAVAAGAAQNLNLSELDCLVRILFPVFHHLI